MDYCLIVIIIAVPIALVTIIIFIKINRIEKQINKLCKEKREEIKTVKESPAFLCCSASGIERKMLDNKIEDYNLQIEELERKRRFLIDKLPFLKK